MRTLFMLRLMIIILTHFNTLNPSSEKSIPDDMDVHGALNLYTLYILAVFI